MSISTQTYVRKSRVSLVHFNRNTGLGCSSAFQPGLKFMTIVTCCKNGVTISQHYSDILYVRISICRQPTVGSRVAYLSRNILK